MDCRDAERFVQLRLDEEIDAGDCGDLERHLELCATCRGRIEAEARFQAELKSHLRDRVQLVAAPSSLRQRLTDQIRAESTTSTGSSTSRVLAAALAAGVLAALSWGATSRHARVYEDTVARHSSNLPPEVRALDDEAEVDRFLERNLRYRIAVPRVAGRDSQVRLVGARLSNIDDRDAAYVMYDHRGAKLSLFAYPFSESLRESDGLERRVVGGREIYVGQRRGYNVVFWKDRELMYSLVSDVDPNELVTLVRTMR